MVPTLFTLIHLTFPQGHLDALHSTQTLTGIHDVLANHRQRLEEQHNYVPDPEDEKDALIEMLLQYDPSIIKDVLDLSDKEVSDMKGLLENKKAARESDLKKEAEIKP